MNEKLRVKGKLSQMRQIILNEAKNIGFPVKTGVNRENIVQQEWQTQVPGVKYQFLILTFFLSRHVWIYLTDNLAVRWHMIREIRRENVQIESLDDSLNASERMYFILFYDF